MSNEETALVRQSSAIIPRSIEEVSFLAEKLAKSSLLPEALRNKVPEVMMQIMAGQELGLAPMVSLRAFSIIQGKPVMSADAMVAIVLGSGKCEYFRRIEESDEKVTYATKRRGEPERRCTWTMEMAKRASLHQKDNWRGYPRAMLASRAKSELARDVYSDVLAGVFTADEVEPAKSGGAPDAIEVEWSEAPKRMQQVVAEGKLIDEAVEDPPEVTAIDDIDTIHALKAHASTLAALKLTGSAKDRATKRYNDRLSALKRLASQPANSEQQSEAAAQP